MASDGRSVEADGRTDREGPASSLRPAIAGTIDGIEAGDVVGRVSGVGSGDRVTLSFNRRVIGSAPLGAADADGWSAFRFNARSCPPALLATETISVALELARQPGEILDTSQVPVRDFLKPGDLQPARTARRFEGCFDGITNGVLRGWVWDGAKPERRLEILAFLDNRFVGTFSAGLPRPDLAATGRGDGRYGFEIPAQGILASLATTAPDVALFAGSESWPIPIGAHAAAKKRGDAASALPRLRDIPDTVEAFARILTSLEPFPKKVFVLDKLKQGSMPDAFKADYVLLAMELLRHELVAAGESMDGSWRERMTRWAHMRAVGVQIRRLEELAKTVTIGPSLLAASANDGGSAGDRRADQKP